MTAAHAPTAPSASWDFPPLVVALRCVREDRATLDATTLAEAAVLFRTYGLGPLPDLEALRDPNSWAAWLPLCAAAYCQNLVEQHRATGTLKPLSKALQALAQAEVIDIALRLEHNTPDAQTLTRIFVGQLQKTAREHYNILVGTRERPQSR